MDKVMKDLRVNATGQQRNYLRFAYVPTRVIQFYPDTVINKRIWIWLIEYRQGERTNTQGGWYKTQKWVE